MTQKLYDLNAYATKFAGTVLSCEMAKREDEDCFLVVLDQTLFFPEEGGQSPDKGSLNGVDVIDVQIQKDKETGEEQILHYTREALPVGQQVEGIVDWQHRFSNMQQHSGEHIFSGIVHKRFGYDNVGFHLSDQIVTLDFNGVLTEEDVASVEDEVNRAIVKNVPITATWPTSDELKKLDYRSKKEIDGRVRIVTVEGYDVCACCAPHVKHSGEIGMLKVMSLQNYKGGVRISILCGYRALNAFREKCAVVSQLTGLLTTGQDMLCSSVEKLMTTNQTLKSKLGSLSGQLLETEVNALDPNLKDVLLFKEELDANALRNTVNLLKEKYQGLCGVFSGSDEEGYSYVIGSQTLDCKEIAAKLRDGLNARGGGNSQMIQGFVGASEAAVRELLL